VTGGNIEDGGRDDGTPPAGPVGDAAPQRSLGVRAMRGAGSVMAGQAARIVLQVGSVAILSRLLAPRDYGLLAMVMVVVGFGEAFRDFGLSTAAIRAPSLSRGQRDVLFWLNCALGAGFAAVLALAAPLVALWFRQPELVGMARWLSLVFLLNGAVAQYRAGLNRSMRFNALVASDLLGMLFGVVVAVVMALTGWGYWALVGQQIGTGVGVLVLAVIYSRWLPGLPKRGTQVGSMVKFGMNMSATQLVGYVNNNVDTIVVGSFLGVVPLGLYNRGYQLLMRAVNQFRGPTTTIALPVLSRLETREQNDRFIVQGQLALGYTLVAGLAFCGAAAVPIIDIFLGRQWAEVAPVFAFLAIAAIFQTTAYVGYWIYLSRGLTKHLLGYSLIGVAMRVVCILAGLPFGIVGVAAGFAVSDALSWPVSIWWLSRFTPMPVRSLYGGAARVLGLAAVSGLASNLVIRQLAGWPSVAQIAVGLLVALASYGLAMLIFPRVRSEVLELVRLFLRAWRPRAAKS
jgi:PST family polysaccharide transporter